MRRGFTLIELLVVIAIVAVIAVVLVITLNPSELLKQARDSTRVSDLTTLNKALAIHQVDVPGVSLGTSSVVYVSLPDSSATCANLGLPSLPSGWSYACKATSTYRNTDGTGWIPVDFNQLAAGSPVSALPVDPINGTAGTLYYTFSVDPSNNYGLVAMMESEKYLVTAQRDGGVEPWRFEVGSNLQLAASQFGLVGYWNFEEGSGTTVSDSSGNGHHGTWSSVSGTHWEAGKVGSWAGRGVGSQWIEMNNDSSLMPNAFTVTAWVKSSTLTFSVICWNTNNPCLNYYHSSNRALMYLGGGNFRYFLPTPVNPFDNTWHFVAFTVPGATQPSINSAQMIVDGQPLDIQQTAVTTGQNSKAFFHLLIAPTGTLLDDVRLYNRVLSNTELEAIYNSTR